MKKYIATWVYLDSPEEKSKYPNTGGDSTSPEFQAVYWRCIVLFYETSLRFHKEVQHLFFTNTETLPIVDGFDVKLFFTKNHIQVVPLENLYPLPENYFGRFRNQFFEFSIIDHVAKMLDGNDMLVLLDSDCVFSKSFLPAFDKLFNSDLPAISYVVDFSENYELHGVTGNDMRQISSDLGLKLEKNPYYSGGELLFAKGSFFHHVAQDFPTLYQNLMERHQQNEIKFNEEAHVLSYYYYKLKADIGGMNGYIKRMWTNRNYYRNVLPEDSNLTIWHLPNEKRVGIDRLFQMINEGKSLRSLAQIEYHKLLEDSLLMASNHKWDYYKLLKGTGYKVLRKLKVWRK